MPPSNPVPTAIPAQPTAVPPINTPSGTPVSTGNPVAIPQLALWESRMIDFGTRNCEALKNLTGTADDQLRNTYYDAEWVFYQIADYTKNPSFWNQCAQAAEKVYRDNYMYPANGNLPGYWSFTHGLMQDYLRTGDTRSKDGALLIAKEAAYLRDSTPLDWTAPADLSREVSYAITAYLNAETLGQPRRARLTQLVDQAFGHLDQWFVSKTAPYVRPFMVALTAHALISWHEASGDARVIPALSTAMDYIWDRTWKPEAGAFSYTDRSIGNPDDLLPAYDLNLLIAPAFAWLYHQTGDVKFRDRGDQVFAGGVKSAYLVGGKQFNQSYRLSFEYVRLRQMAPLK